MTHLLAPKPPSKPRIHNSESKTCPSGRLCNYVHFICPLLQTLLRYCLPVARPAQYDKVPSEDQGCIIKQSLLAGAVMSAAPHCSSKYTRSHR